MFQQATLCFRHRRHTEALAASEKRDFSVLCREVQSLAADLHSSLSRWAKACWQYLPFSTHHASEGAVMPSIDHLLSEPCFEVQACGGSS